MGRFWYAFEGRIYGAHRRIYSTIAELGFLGMPDIWSHKELAGGMVVMQGGI